MTPEQESKSRDEIWNAAYQKWYDAYFNEIVAGRMIDRWQAFNDPAKVIIAVTTSGSVVAGWTLWNQPVYKTFWIMLAGLVALLSVISGSLTIPERIKDWTSTKADFSGVRMQAELLRTQMKLNPEFDVAQAHKSLENIMLRHNDAVNRIRNDFLHARSLDLACKKELDDLLLVRKLWS